MGCDSSREERFLSQARIRRGDDFRQTYARKCSAADRLVIMYARTNSLGYSRIGLSVSRKHGSAVRRNRWKRLLREAFRLERTRLPVGLDLVLIPRQGAQPELAALRESLVDLSKQLVRRSDRSAESKR